ncbi:hypothetical protein PATSB16_32570 [Pandoraea thiooxydans]|nr:hypothetical protein PATSB16_32570 [Pandoraea thiooxydans]
MGIAARLRRARWHVGTRSVWCAAVRGGISDQEKNGGARG